MKKNTAPFLFACLLFPLISQAQAPVETPASLPGFGCSSEAAMQSVQGLQQFQQQLEEHLLTLSSNRNVNPGGLPYILPVVVHVIHQNGTENLSDQRIFDAISHLNDAFAHTGYYGQQGAGANTAIQFCLAQRTPTGEPTNGIVRVESPLTDMEMQSDDVNLKNLSRWNPFDYVNIWVVKSITSQSSGPGVAGYAYLASAHGAEYDGVVCEAAFFGASEQQDAVLIHEIGHYLNLYHTFQGGCPNGDCQVNGDRVCDTPPDQTNFSACDFNSCNTDADDTSPNNPLSSDVNDATENFMDYSPFSCYHAFSEGQGERMRLAIEFFRSSLLDSKGCKEPCLTPLTASFSFSPSEVFAGETVTLANLSTGATGYEWSLNGSVFSTSFEPSLTFDSAGIFLLQLAVTNGDANCYEVHLANVTVKCPVDAGFTANASLLKVGEPFLGTNLSTGAVNYEWFVNDVPVSTEVDLDFTFSNPGYYTVKLVASNGFCSLAYQRGVTVRPELPCSGYVEAYCYETNDFFPLLLHVFPVGEMLIYLNEGFDGGVLLKLDKEGNIIWKSMLEGFSNSSINTISLMDDGGFIILLDDGGCCKTKLCKLSESGEVEWTKKLTNPNPTRNFKIGKVGNDVIAYDSHGLNPNRLYLVRTGPDGVEKWNKVFQLVSAYNIFDVVPTKDGQGFWAIGRMNNLEGAGLILKFDEDGNYLFSKKYLGSPNPGITFKQAAPTADNGLFITGQSIFNGVIYGHLVCKLDAFGEIEWAKYASIEVGNSNALQFDILVKLPLGGFLLSFKRGDAAGNEYSDWVSFTEEGDWEFTERITSPADSALFVQTVVESGGKLFAGVQSYTDRRKMCLVELDSTGRLPDCPGKVSLPEEFTPFEMTALDLTFVPGTFPATVEASFAVEVDETFPFFRSPFCPIDLPCPELCENGLDDDEDGFTDCFDPGCACFAGPDCRTEDAPPVEARLAWESDAGLTPSNATPIAANLNPQASSLPEIIVAEGSAGNPANLLIFHGDGSNAAVPDVLPVPGALGAVTPTPAVADIDSDGVPELITVSADHRIRVFTGYSPGSQPPMVLMLSSADLTATNFVSPQLADFNQDGVPEIILGNEIFQFDFNANPPTLTKVLAGNNHAGQFATGADAIPMAFDLLAVSDCGGDPDCEGLELVAGAYVYSIDLNPFDGDGLEMKVQRNLHDFFPGPSFGDGHTFVADVNLDWTPDIVTAGSVNGNPGIYVWNKYGYTQFFPYPAPPTGTGTQFATATVANVFDDKKAGFFNDWPEIVATSAGWVTAFNFQALGSASYGNHWWSVPSDDQGHAGATCFDLNGDGLAEIFLRDQTRFRLMYGSAGPFPAGVDADRNWFTLDCFSETYHEYPIVADLDADGQAEVAFTGSSEASAGGRLRVVESAGNAWAPARPVWNQYQYFGLNVNDDLSISRQQQRHDLEFPEPFTRHRPFNVSLSQLLAVDENFEPYLPVPDATIEVGEIHCENDSLRVSVTICNAGSTSLPDRLPVAFYRGDPRQAGAQPLGWFPLGKTVKAGECATAQFEVAGVFNAPVYVVANDDQSGPLPYNPASNFPVTRFLECDYENNFTSFNFQFPAVQLDLGPDRNQCENNVLTLHAGAAFAKYRWQDGYADSVFTVFEPGKYWVDVWDACGGFQTDTVEVAVSPPFELTVDTVLNASGVAASDGAIFVEMVQGGVPPFSFQWSNGPATPSNPGIPPGDYSVTVTGADGCEKIYHFTVDAVVGSSDFEAEKWQAMLVPNPASKSGQADLVIRSNMFQVIDFQLIDVAGRTLSKDQLTVNAGTFTRRLPVPPVPGLYLVLLTNGQGRRVFLKWVVY